MGRTIVGGTGVLSMEVGIFDNDLWWWRLLPARWACGVNLLQYARGDLQSIGRRRSVKF
jgi:hypothetical protein